MNFLKPVLIILGIALLIFLSVRTAQHHFRHQPPPKPSPDFDSDAEKLADLEDAYKSGAITEEQYESKLAELRRHRGGSTPEPSDGFGGEGDRASGHGSYVHMKMVRVVDREGFGEPIEVYRMLIPYGWKLESQVRWSVENIRCPSNVVVISYRISSPDGSITFERFPDYAWKWYDDPMARQVQQNGSAMNMACDVNPILSATDYIDQVLLPRIRRGVRPINGESLPEVAQSQTQLFADMFQQETRMGVLQGLKVDSGRVRLQYSAQGQPFEESILGNVLTLAAPMQSPTAMMNGGGGISHDFSVMTVGLYSVRAPQGQMDAANKLAGLVMASTRSNPRWWSAERDVIQGLYRQQGQGAMDRSAIWQRYANESNQMIVQDFQRQQNSQNHLARQYDQSLRGVQNYYDPGAQEQVELTGGYHQAWSNGQNEYILTNDPNFNPNVELRQNWVELRPLHD